jgi:UPF0716 protein FxsA
VPGEVLVDGPEVDEQAALVEDAPHLVGGQRTEIHGHEYASRVIALLAFAFLVVPIAELAVIVAVAQQVGVIETIGILIVVSILGSVLAKRQGMEVWARFRTALARGDIPSEEIIDGFLVLLGAALLLTPGFLTDVLGIVLLVPPSRRIVKAGVRSGVRRRIVARAGRGRRGARTVRVVRVSPGSGSNSPRGGEEQRS